MANSTLPLSFQKALPWVIFVSVLFTTIYISRSILAPLIIPLEKTLNIGHTQATSLFFIQYLGFSVSLFLCGFLLSKICPAHMAAISLSFIGLFLCFMPYIETLNEARFLFVLIGFGGGFYFPAGMAILSTLVYPKDWGKAMGIHELAPIITFITLPLLADLLLKITTWKGVCAYTGGTILVIGLCFGFWGKGGKAYIQPPSLTGCTKLICNSASWAFTILLTITMTGEFAIFSTLQLYLTNNLQFSTQESNTITAFSRLFTPIAVIVGGWASDRFNPYIIIKISLIIHALALVSMSINIIEFVFIGISFQASIIAFLFPNILKVFALRFPLQQQPVVLSLFMPIAGIFSNGIMPLFIGYCGEFLSFKVGFLSIALFSIASLLAISPLKRHPIE